MKTFAILALACLISLSASMSPGVAIAGAPCDPNVRTC